MKLPANHIPGVGLVVPSAYGGVGEKLLKNMGWVEGRGLGLNGQGMKAAIEAKVKEDNSGVGKNNTQIWEDKWWEDAYSTAVKEINMVGQADSDSGASSDEEVGFTEVEVRNPDGTSSSATRHELQILRSLNTQPSRIAAGRLVGRAGKLARIQAQEAMAHARVAHLSRTGDLSGAPQGPSRSSPHRTTDRTATGPSTGSEDRRCLPAVDGGAAAARRRCDSEEMPRCVLAAATCQSDPAGVRGPGALGRCSPPSGPAAAPQGGRQMEGLSHGGGQTPAPAGGGRKKRKGGADSHPEYGAAGVKTKTRRKKEKKDDMDILHVRQAGDGGAMEGTTQGINQGSSGEAAGPNKRRKDKHGDSARSKKGRIPDTLGGDRAAETGTQGAAERGTLGAVETSTRGATGTGVRASAVLSQAGVCRSGPLPEAVGQHEGQPGASSLLLEQRPGRSCVAPSAALPAGRQRVDWWGQGRFVSGGLLEGLGEDSRGPQERQVFDESTQEALYDNAHGKKTAGKQGLGTRSLPRKVGGVRWQGQKLVFEDDDVALPGLSDSLRITKPCKIVFVKVADDEAANNEGEARERTAAQAQDCRASDAPALKIKWRKLATRALKQATGEGLSLRSLLRAIVGAAPSAQAGPLAALSRKEQRRLLKNQVSACPRFTFIGQKIKLSQQ
eukprot:jgi/Botrbrau1/18462/Bobra.0072s0045.1